MQEGRGFIRSELDLKILILYALARLPGKVDWLVFQDLILSSDGAINYFDYTSAVADLVDTGHIIHEARSYLITEKGRRNSEATETEVPYSVRTRAERLMEPIALAIRRDAMIKTSHEPAITGGFMVKLSMHDDRGEVIGMRLVSPDEKTAEQMEERFRKDAESLYSSIIELLLKD